MKIKNLSSKMMLMAMAMICHWSVAQAQYQADELGSGTSFMRLQMAPDYEGEVAVTLVKRSTLAGNKAVLYVHGFCDYFFNLEMAKKFNEAGYHFYAVDLRKYGRSLLPNQQANQCRSLTEYYPDLDTALAIMRAEGMSDITLLAHSTGGLTSSLYMKHGQNAKLVNRLVLNSPFFDMNQNWFMENIAVPMVSFLGKFFPKMKLPGGLSGLYGESIHKDYKGEWDYRLDWKPIIAFQMDAGWLRAIRLGQKELQDGLNISVPVLVMHSDKSIYVKKWDEQLFTGDAVLDVKDIHAYGKTLGPNVKEAIVPNGLHDLSLSKITARENFYQQVLLFLP